MIRMVQSSSAGHAKAYFSDALQKSDYYLDDQELQGSMNGLLADRLQVAVPATKEVFFALCENKNPATGKPLTLRTKEQRTTGYDINFHCPKSVSVVHALSKDDHILKAFKESVYETMKDIEADAKTRIRKGGTYDDRETGELIWADFTHQTARPVDGSAPDPHLHSHCFVFNVTWDGEEKQYKAGQFRDIKRDMPFYQARFHKRLSDKMMDIGYRVRQTDKSFEIEGVPQQVIDLFSKRTDEIGRVAKEQGITDAKQRSELGARTRAKKQKGYSMAELKVLWRAQIRALGGIDKEADKAVRFAREKEISTMPVDRCMEHSIKHSFERASVMPERRLLATAFRYSIGNARVRLDEIEKKFKANPAIIYVKEKYRTVCTTKEVLQEERTMVQLARQGVGKLRPSYAQAPAISLKGQQAEAVRHVVTTADRVSIIRGAAGSGKTTLLKEANRLFADAGRKVHVFAPTAAASRGVLREEGFEKAETVFRLLTDQKLQKDIENQVLWIDEAGLLGTKDMSDLLALTARKGAQLILGGDTRQHASVVRGDALRILNTVAGIRPAEVNRIYRQKNVHFKSAVEALSKGDVKAGFDKLDSIGFIENVDALKPNEQLVRDYVAAVKKGKKALIVSPTHKQGDDVTDAVRKKLRQAGMIGKKEIKARALSNLNLTEAEKSDWRNFKAGQVVYFNQNVPGIKRGASYSVADVANEKVKVQDENGKAVTLPLNRPKTYGVYESAEINLAKGDKIQITRNGFDTKEKRLNNGQMLDVVSVSKKGNITLRNTASKVVYEINDSYGHIAHAHCITSHSSQGKTVDEVFIAQPSATFAATDAKQFYVSVSRARERATIYTDDKAALLEYASELGDRQSALELLRNNSKQKDYVQQRERNSYQKAEATREKTKDRPAPSPVKDQDYEPGI